MPSSKPSLFKRPIKPERMLALGFLALIITGGMILMLPACASDGHSIGPRAGFFTAASAVCVTGMNIIDPGVDLSLAGQIVLLALIQVGGLGFMAFATLVMATLGKKMSLKSRLLLRDSMNQTTLSGMVRLSLVFFLMAIVIETAGALLLMIRFVPLYGAKGVWYSFFTAVSAFCNAGFDLFGTGGVQHLQHEGYVLSVLGMLVVLGGMGFSVILECLQQRFRFRALSLHSKLALVTTAALFAAGAALTLLLEWRNPATLGQMSVWDKLANGLFHSVTLRSAGFASLNPAGLTDASKLLDMPLMFIGASSASTAGGVKTTTAAMIVLMVAAVARGRKNIRVFGREIPAATARRAVAIVFIGMALMLVSACIISTLEAAKGLDMLDVLFETTAAFSTTGLSSVGTANLSIASQWLLLPLMFFGRVGPLTLAFALASRMEQAASARARYPEENIMIG